MTGSANGAAEHRDPAAAVTRATDTARYAAWA